MESKGGGVATQRGINYQNRVAAWFCVRILAEQEADPLWGWDNSSTIEWIRCETEEPIDDLMIGNSHQGIAFINVKHKVYANKESTSALASVISQFVRQFISSRSRQKGLLLWERPLDSRLDRFVLVVNSDSSAAIKTYLPAILGRLRASDFGGSLNDAAKTKGERELLALIRSHLEREWITITRQSFGEQDIISLLSLVRIEVLDVDPNEADERRAKEILRASVLADPSQADTVWHTLIQFCSVFATEQSGGNRQALRDSLLKVGIKLKSSRSYYNDIELLKQLSQETLDSLLSLSQIVIKPNEKPIKINRECSKILNEASETDSYVVVGEPGAGKSGVLHDVVQRWIAEESRDVIFLAIDRLEARSLKSLRLELGLEHELTEILQNWSGDQSGFLVIDALDAARSGEKEQAILDLISRVHDLAPRWRIVASIRQFDLRHNTKIQSLFRGRPHSKFHSDEYSLFTTCHFNIPKLEMQELDQISSQSAELGELIQKADSKLHSLLRIPFNIKLIADLIGSGVSIDSLTPIRTQIELLERYWQERIIHPLDKRDAKELILSRTVEKMVKTRSLRIDRSKVVTQTTDAPILTEILSANVLAEWSSQAGGKVNDKFLTFAHHVLFDYAVARLLLRKEPSELIYLLEQDPELIIAIRPSLLMHFEYELMHNLKQFWGLIFQVIRSAILPEICKLIGPSVAVESLFKIEDFSLLIEALNTKDKDKREIAERTFRHIAGALMVKAVAAKEHFIRSMDPDWSELLDLVTEQVSPLVAYSSRPLLHILCENPEFLTHKQQLFVGKTARKIFNFALSQQPRESSLVTSAIELVCRTYESNLAESSKLLRRCLTLEHVSEYGHEELIRFAQEVSQLIHVAPDLVEELYRVAFTINDLSDEKTDVGVSQIVAMSSTRRQDYHLARWKLEQDFSKFLEVSPLNATKALLAILDTYSRERYSTRWFISDEEELAPAPEETFVFGGKIGFLRTDRSEVWDEGAGSRDDEPVQILHQFRNYLEEISGKNGDTKLLRQRIIDLIVAENRTSAVWRQLIKVATEYPQTLGLEIRSLCWTLPFLISDDTYNLLGELLKAVFPHLDPIERERVEQTILSIYKPEGDEKYIEYRRNLLLGCLAVDALVTEEAKSTLKHLRETDQIPSNHFRSRSTVGGAGIYTDEHYLRDQGVLVEEEASQKIQNLTKPVREFAEQFSNSSPSISDFEAILPALGELHHALKLADQTGIHERQQSLSWGYLAWACRNTTKCEAMKCESENAVFIKSILLEIADYPDPQPELNDRHFDRSQGWGSPAARVDATQGLISLARHRSCVDKNLLSKIELLKTDLVPAVRFQIAANLTNLYYTDRDLMWRLIDYFSYEEQSKGVLKWLVMASLAQLAAYHADEIAKSVQVIFERIREGEGAEEVRKECASILVGLYVWQGHELCKKLVDKIAHDPIHHSPEAHQVIFNLRPVLNVGVVDDTESKENQARQRAFLLMEKILKSVFDYIQTLEEKNKGQPFNLWTQEEQEAGKSLGHLVGSICTELYFASGAYTESGNDKINRGERERKRYLEQSLPMLRLLSEYGHPSTAYHLCQTLEYLLPHDPAEVFLLIRKVISEGRKGGYQFESLAADLIVKIVERFIAEYQSVLQQNKDCRQALIDILDIFIDAGWASARRLTYRMEEIFR